MLFSSRVYTMSSEEAERSRQLVVVAREQISLYQTLREAFTELPGVTVIRDRRVAPPRSPVLERRRNVRADTELRRAGYAVVKVKGDASGAGHQSRPAAASF